MNAFFIVNVTGNIEIIEFYEFYGIILKIFLIFRMDGGERLNPLAPMRGFMIFKKSTVGYSEIIGPLSIFRRQAKKLARLCANRVPIRCSYTKCVQKNNDNF